MLVAAEKFGCITRPGYKLHNMILLLSTTGNTTSTIMDLLHESPYHILRIQLAALWLICIFCYNCCKEHLILSSQIASMCKHIIKANSKCCLLCLLVASAII